MMNDSQDVRVDIVDDSSAEKVEVINSFLRIHNQAANPEWWATLDNPNYDSKPLHVVVHNGENEVVGGLLATTSMSWLKIQIMAVREDYRRQGLGTLILNRAEAEAQRRGCKYGFVDTMDYQSPEFYRRNGYEVAGSIADWDSHKHTKFYFTKQLMHANSGDDLDTGAPPAAAIGPRFGLKDLLTLTAIVAFVSSAINLMLKVNLSFVAIVPLILPWAVGTYVGISKMARRQQSTLIGGLVGGGLGALLFPGLPTIFFYTPVSMMIRIGYAAWGVGIGMCCGGIVSGIVGVVGGRLSVRRRTSID